MSEERVRLCPELEVMITPMVKAQSTRTELCRAAMMTALLIAENKMWGISFIGANEIRRLAGKEPVKQE